MKKKKFGERKRILKYKKRESLLEVKNETNRKYRRNEIKDDEK